MTATRPINRQGILFCVLIALICILIIWFVHSCMRANDAGKLCNATENNDMEQLQRLLDEGAYVNSMDHTIFYLPIAAILEADIRTPLGTACEEGNYEAVKLLLEHGANPNFRIPLGFSGIGAVYATPKGRASRFSIIPLLLSYGASADDPWLNQSRPHAAFREVALAKEETAEQSIALIELMTDDPAGLKNAVGATPLAICESPSVAQWLIACGADINEADIHGRTPLMHAATRNSQEMVACLLQCGADKNLTNKDGKSAYDLAVDRGFTDIASLLE